MSQRPDENGRLTGLLQALRVPEPSAEFLAGARRRYLDAIEMRDRRQVLQAIADLAHDVRVERVRDRPHQKRVAVR